MTITRSIAVKGLKCSILLSSMNKHQHYTAGWSITWINTSLAQWPEVVWRNKSVQHWNKQSEIAGSKHISEIASRGNTTLAQSFNPCMCYWNKHHPDTVVESLTGRNITLAQLFSLTGWNTTLAQLCEDLLEETPPWNSCLKSDWKKHHVSSVVWSLIGINTPLAQLFEVWLEDPPPPGSIVWSLIGRNTTLAQSFKA